MELYQLVAGHRQLTQHFNRNEYPAYYREYRETVASAMDEISDIPAAVNHLADGLERERDWKAEKFWKRAATARRRPDADQRVFGSRSAGS